MWHSDKSWFVFQPSFIPPIVKSNIVMSGYNPTVDRNALVLSAK